jgi:hypothetical protein
MVMGGEFGSIENVNNGGSSGVLHKGPPESPVGEKDCKVALGSGRARVIVFAPWNWKSAREDAHYSDSQCANGKKLQAS